MLEDEDAVFIETNTNSAVPVLLKVLADSGRKAENVKYIIVTHVHLDHAGGTSALIDECRNAMVLAHPRALPHLINPEKLIKGAMAVYGADKFERLYGRISPIDPARIRAMDDGEELVFGSRSLRFMHTLGHSKHHFCVYDSGENCIFTGDSFGLCYPVLQKGSRPFIYPSTTPSDFDPDEYLKSVKRITGSGASRAYLTHFGPVDDIPGKADMLNECLFKMKTIMDGALSTGYSGEELDDFCNRKVKNFFIHELASRGISFTGAISHFMGMDIYLNAMGISLAASRKAGLK
ncbi:MAG: MBL fold metallo-hydrolase [Spirochaetes bacterium]|nr:MBL fold metallo-hydrolase [Spirochaetota bacterium]